MRHAQYRRGGVSIRSRRAVQASRNRVVLPDRASTASATSLGEERSAPEHQVSVASPPRDIRSGKTAGSSAKTSDARSERRWTLAL